MRFNQDNVYKNPLGNWWVNSFALVCEFIEMYQTYTTYTITHFNKINSSINPQAAKAEIVSQDFLDWDIYLEQT